VVSAPEGESQIMSDEYLQGIMGRPNEIGEVHYTYTPQEEAARRQLIDLIEMEKRAFLERIEPYVKRLGSIQGTPHWLIRAHEAKQGGGK